MSSNFECIGGRRSVWCRKAELSRERLRTLRYRNLLVWQLLQVKIIISALLMEADVTDPHSPGHWQLGLASTRMHESTLVGLSDRFLMLLAKLHTE